MQTLLQKLTSRKFWIVIFAMFAILYGLIPEEQTFEFVLLILGYLGAEGYVDASREEQ